MLQPETDDLPQIRNLEDLLTEELKPGEKVVGSDLSRLTAPGENYGSLMLRVIIYIKNSSTGAQRTVDAVGKLIPESELVQKVFNTQVTFKSEYNFYALMVPIMDRYLKVKGFPEGATYAAPFLGGRPNLDGGPQVDKDAVILLKNLKTAGYDTGVKFEGLNVPEVKLVLEALAKFHAAVIGVRHQHPEVYEQKFRPHFYSYNPEQMRQKSLGNFKNVIQGDPELSEEQVQLAVETFQCDFRKVDISEHWGTMIHYDTWTNNILIKHDHSGNPTNCVLVDFQVIEHGSPLNDVMFFLFSSVQQEPFETSLDDFLEYYYVTFTNNLSRMGLNLDHFSRESFQREIRWAVRYEYMHTVWMLLPLMNETFKSVEQFKPAADGEEEVEWSERHVNKIKAVTRMCFRKGWM